METTNKAELARAFFYIMIFITILCCLPAIWSAICTAMVGVLHGLAFLILFCALLSLCSSLVSWIASGKQEDGSYVWTFA